MELLIFILIGISACISLPATWGILRISKRYGLVDSKAVEGQIKEESRRIPNTGGIAIALGILIPMIIAIIGISLFDPNSYPAFLAPLQEHISGLKSVMPLGWTLVGCLLGLHLLGLLDDRRPMGPWGKLAIMLIPGIIFAAFFDTRLMTMLDSYVGGRWLSILITVFWFTLITNAMNFIDNMDGLSSGIAIIAGGSLLAAAILNEQWFVAAILALLIGSCFGFWVFNFPPAKIFMGDSGSLIIGMLLAFLTVRTTYLPISETSSNASNWYAVLMPVVVLAIPLYDFFSVTSIRIMQGKSPFVGDLQHFSHRIRDRGLSGRCTILVIYCLTIATAISGLLLARANQWQAALLGIQVVLLLAAIALFEYRSPNSPQRDGV
ncbi:MAG: MraY family glycosyltransferase [Phycisphaerales bacterium]|nr:MraY family glycosyltransferase [Phycisphaerales bacterium]